VVDDVVARAHAVDVTVQTTSIDKIVVLVR